MLQSFTSDPVSNVNERVFDDHSDAQWIKHITQVGDGSFDGIDIETDLKVSKDSQHIAVEICEAYTKAMSTDGRVRVLGLEPDEQMDGSTDWDDTQLAANLPGGFFSQVKATEACVRDTDGGDEFLEETTPVVPGTSASVAPDLVGTNPEDADGYMEKLGYVSYENLSVEDATGAERAPMSFDSWIVTKQEPEAGETLPEGKKFTVWVKKRSE
ncbi:PASTA domain-containing protein [Nocardioides sp. B-3]|uniref:PASTA domain-containing protein n=1 Tax=Nocardioides sp. B-3 TaxID=2895565 RepID=UPI0021520EE9|nr:PASTA domain-containing protein [Nocardioides sp. B-3]UUZ60558.1 PASTA domain-containing protein [Nocardioides sp. B-3]